LPVIWVANCYARHTHAYTESSWCVKKTHGCYLTIKRLQFSVKIQYKFVIRRYGTVINMICKHHLVFGVYKIKIQALCLAAYTIICDSRQYIYIYIISLNFKTVRPKWCVLCTNFNFNFLSDLNTKLII
jgi:hypothetical protein